MFSDDIRPRHWNQMITETLAAFDRGSRGVVITHGTDTMATSAAAMSFAWSGDGGRPRVQLYLQEPRDLQIGVRVMLERI